MALWLLDRGSLGEKVVFLLILNEVLGIPNADYDVAVFEQLAGRRGSIAVLTYWTSLESQSSAKKSLPRDTLRIEALLSLFFSIRRFRFISVFCAALNMESSWFPNSPFTDEASWWSRTSKALRFKP